MKQFLKENIIIVIIISCLLILISLIVYEYITIEAIPIGAVVLEHNVTANRRGHRTYTTLIKTDDGFIIEKEGLNYYIIPTGSRVTIEVRRPKNGLKIIKRSKL
jgi:hypothetical protein